MIIATVHLPDRGKPATDFTVALDTLSCAISKMQGNGNANADKKQLILAGDFNFEFDEEMQPYVGSLGFGAGTACTARGGAIYAFLIEHGLYVATTFADIGPTFVGHGLDASSRIDHVMCSLGVMCENVGVAVDIIGELKSDHLPICFGAGVCYTRVNKQLRNEAFAEKEQGDAIMRELRPWVAEREKLLRSRSHLVGWEPEAEDERLRFQKAVEVAWTQQDETDTLLSASNAIGLAASYVAPSPSAKQRRPRQWALRQSIAIPVEERKPLAELISFSNRAVDISQKKCC